MYHRIRSMRPLKFVGASRDQVDARKVSAWFGKAIKAKWLWLVIHSAGVSMIAELIVPSKNLRSWVDYYC